MPDNISKFYSAFSAKYDNFKNEDEFRDYLNSADSGKVQKLYNAFSAKYDNFKSPDEMINYLGWEDKSAAPADAAKQSDTGFPVFNDEPNGAAIGAKPAKPASAPREKEDRPLTPEEIAKYNMKASLQRAQVKGDMDYTGDVAEQAKAGVSQEAVSEAFKNKPLEEQSGLAPSSREKREEAKYAIGQTEYTPYEYKSQIDRERDDLYGRASAEAAIRATENAPKTFLGKVVRSMGESAQEDIATGRMAMKEKYKFTSEEQSEIRKYDAASALMQEVLDLDKEDRRQQSKEHMTGAQKVLFELFKEAPKGAWDTAKNVRTWDTLTQLEDGAALVELRNDLQNIANNAPKGLTEEEYEKYYEDALSSGDLALMRALAFRNNADTDKTGWGYKGGSSAVQSARFFADFFLLGGVTQGVAEAATNGLTRFIAKQAIRAGANKIARAAIKGTGKFVLGNAKAAIAGTLQTVLNPTTYAHAMQAVGNSDEDESWVATAANSLLDDFVENGTEYGLGFMRSAAGLTGKALHQATKDVPWGKLFKANPMVRDLGRSMALGNALEELNEEVDGAIIRTITGLDKNAWNEFTTWDNLLTLGISFFPMIGGGQFLSVAQSQLSGRQKASADKAADSALASNGYSAELIENFHSAMTSKTPQELIANLSPFMKQIASDNPGNVDLMRALYRDAMANANYMQTNGVMESQQEEKRAALLQELSEKYGQFWSTRQQNQLEVNEVRVLNLPWEGGTECYVVGYDEENGQLILKDQDGKNHFINDAELESMVQGGTATDTGAMKLRDYLEKELVARGQAAEQERMATDYADNLTALQQRVQQDGGINVGTPEAEVWGTLVEVNPGPDGGIVVSVEGEPAPRAISWQEVASQYGMPLEPKTDEDIVNDRLAVDEAVKKYNEAIQPGADLQVPVEGTDEVATYRFKRVQDIDGDVIVKAVDPETGNEVDLAPEMISNLDDLATPQVPVADVEGNPVPATAPVAEPVEVFDDPVANEMGISKDFAFTTKKGKTVVDGNKLWNSNPKLWAEWNDRNPNRVVPTKDFLADKLKGIDKEVSAAKTALEAEAKGSQNPDTLEELQDRYNEKVSRQQEVKDLLDSYEAAEKAAKEAEKVQQEALKAAEEAARKAEEESAKALQEQQEREKSLRQILEENGLTIDENGNVTESTVPEHVEVRNAAPEQAGVGPAADTGTGADTGAVQAEGDTGVEAKSNIQGLENYSENEISDLVKGHMGALVSEVGENEFNPEKITVVGSRTKGTARPDSDLDVLVEYSGSMREDDVFNALNGEHLVIDGITVDINPIRKEQSGTTEQWLSRNGGFTKDQRQALEFIGVSPEKAAIDAAQGKIGDINSRLASASTRAEKVELAREKAAAYQEMFDRLGGENVKVSTREDILGLYKRDGASSTSLEKLEGAIDFCERHAGSRIRGFNDLGNVYLIAEDLASLEDSFLGYSHEDKHLENRTSGAVQEGIDTGIAREEVRTAVHNLAKTDFYDKCGLEELVDEVLSNAAEIAVKSGVDAIPDALRKAGISNEKFINFVQNNIEHGRRNGEHWSHMRLTAPVNDGTEVTRRPGGQAEGRASGDGRSATPGGSGEAAEGSERLSIHGREVAFPSYVTPEQKQSIEKTLNDFTNPEKAGKARELIARINEEIKASEDPGNAAVREEVATLRAEASKNNSMLGKLVKVPARREEFLALKKKNAELNATIREKEASLKTPDTNSAEAQARKDKALLESGIFDNTIWRVIAVIPTDIPAVAEFFKALGWNGDNMMRATEYGFMSHWLSHHGNMSEVEITYDMLQNLYEPIAAGAVEQHKETLQFIRQGKGVVWYTTAVILNKHAGDGSLMLGTTYKDEKNPVKKLDRTLDLGYPKGTAASDRLSSDFDNHGAKVDKKSEFANKNAEKYSPESILQKNELQEFTESQSKQKLPGASYSIVEAEDVGPLFSISKNNRQTIDSWLKKREDLSDEQRASVIDYIDGLDKPALQLATGKWFAQGAIRIPEDMPKVEQAISVAGKAKVDPLKYNSPMELLDAHAEFKPTEKRINPDKVTTLHRAKEYAEQGIVIYDVDDSEESRQNMRQIINTHFGEDASPWCLLQGDGKGNLTEESADYWDEYDSYPKQVAFKDGKLLAFSANDSSRRIWWDRSDRAHEGIPISMKMPNDELGRSATYEYNPATGELGNPSGIHRGNKQNGTYEEWNDEGIQTVKATYKNGKLNGPFERWYDGGQIWMRYGFKDGDFAGDYFEYYPSGNLKHTAHYDSEGHRYGEDIRYYDNGKIETKGVADDKGRQGAWKAWNKKGILTAEIGYKDGKLHGSYIRNFENGKIHIKSTYVDGLEDGLSEEWYANGNKMRETAYRTGVRVGTMTEWAESGNIARVTNYDSRGRKHGEEIEYYDLSEGRHPVGSITRWEHGKRQGLQETFWENGRINNRSNFVDDLMEGVSERWNQDGVLMMRANYESGHMNGLVEMWNMQGELIARAIWENDSVVKKLPLDNTGEGALFSIVTDKDEIDRLEKEPTITLYRAMEKVGEGEYIPPMSQKIPNSAEQKGQRMKPREVVRKGMWQKADEDPAKAYQTETNGPWYYDLKKVKGSDVNGVLYNPYLHLSASPLNDQFTSAYRRPNLVVVECQVPISELTSGYKAEKANDTVGAKDWHSGTVTAQMGEGRQVVLSRWAKIGDEVSDSEVARMVAPKLIEKNIVVPSNVVTPSLKAALQAKGVKFTDVEPELNEPGVDYENTEPSKGAQKVDGQSIKYEHFGGLPASGSQRSLAERTYTKNGSFSFTGRNKIKNVGDVAYIFKELETAAVENSFVAFVKDGIPTILHTGIGSIDNAPIDLSAVIAGFNDFRPDAVYLVHNHPSGNVMYSKADMNLLNAIQGQVGGNTHVEGIIIDTLSGQYGLFRPNGMSYMKEMPTDMEDEMPMEVLSFNKMVFSPEYKRSITTQIRNKEDIASYVSAYRLGSGQKIGALLLNHNMNVMGNLVLPTTELTRENAEAVARQIVNAAVHMGASKAALFGDFGVDSRSCQALQNGIHIASGETVSLVDVIRVEGNHTLSAADNTLHLGDSAAETKSVPEYGVASVTDAAEYSDSDVRFNITTEPEVEKKIREFVKTPEGKRLGWTPATIDGVIKETSDLIKFIDAALTGDKYYDEWAKREPTVKLDWRDGEWKPTVTWARNNIEYKYDMSADLLCINNEGMEDVLASPKMVELMQKINESSKEGFTSDDYLRLYTTLDDMGFVVMCKGCFDAAARIKMLSSVSQKFTDLVNKTIDERNKDPKAFDESVRAMAGDDATMSGFPVSAKNKEEAVRIGVAGDKLTEHVNWTQLMSAEGQTKALSDWGGIFRAWQRTGAGRPKDKLLPEPWTGDLVSTTSTIIGKYGEKTPSFRDLEVNQGMGLRRNSHSEFRPLLAIDEIQFMREAFIKNLTVFKYMKELDDVRLFGKLGVKFNMSFFPAFVPDAPAAGLDKNGDYIAAEESVGGREFEYKGEDGKTHYDGMKGWEEAQKYVNKDVSLSSVVFSIPHLLKAFTDVPTASDPAGKWGSLIPFHASGATRKSLQMQGLGDARALGVGHPFEEAFSGWDKGVTNFEDVQNDRFGDGWEIVEGKKAGTNVNPGHKLEFANGSHYYNKALGLHLLPSFYIFDNELQKGDVNKDGTINKDKASKHGHPFSIDYNDKVKELGTDAAYQKASDYYVGKLRELGLIPRFDFDVPEKVFLKACEDAGVDPRHPKLGWKGEGHSWSPVDSEAYYSLWCDYGMIDPETGKLAPHNPVGVMENGERAFKLPENYLDIIKDGVRRYGERKDRELAMIDDAIAEYAERSVAEGKLKQEDVDAILSEPKFSVTAEDDAEYMKAVESGDMKKAEEMVDKAAKEAGYNIKAYHGTARADRIGNVFRPDRATSGPMAFFTNDRAIAENYAKGKRDTSIAYDSDYDSYETQFRTTNKESGEDIAIYDAWRKLPISERNKIAEKAGHIRGDWEGDGALIYDSETTDANGAWKYQLRDYHGDALKALNEQWLSSGNLFGRENDYLKVLELAGVTEALEKAGYEAPRYMDPEYRDEAVYDVYLKIDKPFDATNMVNEEFISGFEEYADKHEEEYTELTANADAWDKNSVSAEEFAANMRDDLKNGTTYAWTSIPDVMTAYLKQLGYDGIRDKGGKFSGEEHSVWVPFSGEQVKRSDPVTYDDNGNVVPLSKRFNPENSDIRFSVDERGMEDILGPIVNVKDALEKEGVIVNDEALMKEYGLKDLTMTKKKDVVTLNKIVVENQKQGNGTRFMQDLVREADGNGWMLALTPSKDFGATSVDRLKRFYKRFGFVENKGYHVDFSVNESMIRAPRAVPARQDAGIRFAVNNDHERVFFSNAEKAVSDIQMEKATPEQWLKMIERGGGLKAGEDKWIGLSDWLKSQDKKTLTKQEVADYIAQNQIQLEEVYYEDMDDYDAVEESAELVNKEYQDLGADAKALEAMKEKYPGIEDVFEVFRTHGEPNTLVYNNGYEAEKFLEKYDLLKHQINDTRKNYTTEGLQNKREIALTVPTIEPWNENDVVHFGDAGHGRAVAWVRFGDAEISGPVTIDEYEAGIKLTRFQQEMFAKYNEGGQRLYDALNHEERKTWETLTKGYVDARLQKGKPKKVLFIDEIQSKRHQEGREQGYNEISDKERQAAVDERNAAHSKWESAKKDVNDYLQSIFGENYNVTEGSVPKEYVDAHPLTDEQNMRLAELSYAVRQAEREFDEAQFAVNENLTKQKSDIPMAPFEKNWHELAMKRMLRLAAEEGYDYIAWTTGDQQAERYNIGDIVEHIRNEGKTNGLTSIVIRLINGDMIAVDVDEKGEVKKRYDNENRPTELGEYEGKTLGDIIGKELAVRALSLDKYEKIEGEGLRIGASGMKGFYDEILPRFMNKYGKKWGVKVEDVDIPGIGEVDHVNAHTIPVTREMKESVLQGQPLFSISNDRNEIFVSNAELAAERVLMQKASSEQWIKMLEKGGGLKVGEDKWIGLSDWLKSQKGSVTKEQVMDYINKNRIQIEEEHYAQEAEKDYGKAIKSYQDEYAEIAKEKGGDIIAAWEEMIERYGDDFDMAFNIDGDTIWPNYDWHDELTDAAVYFLDQRRETNDGAINSTRLGYTTEGLTNKREIVLTVPTIEPWNENDKIHFGDAGGGRAVAWIRFGDTYVSKAKDDARKAWEKAHEEYLAIRQEIVNKYALEATETKPVKDLATDEENARIHEAYMKDVRLKSAYQHGDFPREKVLVVDEIQSKRHQEGREHGYQDEAATKKRVAELGQEYKRLIKEYEETENELFKMYETIAKSEEAKPFMGEDGNLLPEKTHAYVDYLNSNEEIKALREKSTNALRQTNAIRTEMDSIRDEYKDAVPAAPFEKNWHELAMKRMLRYAAENGYDYIAWTTGEQQAERYNIGDQVSAITRLDGNKFNFRFPSGSSLDIATNDEGVITDVIDNSMVFSYLEGKPLSEFVGKDLAVRMLSMDEHSELADKDLRIGTEGMKGFYDDMLPRFMNKYGKKWGISVEDIKLPDLEEAGQTMHSVPVTDEMKQSVMEGQPMFSVKNDNSVKELASRVRTVNEGLEKAIGKDELGQLLKDAYKAIPQDILQPIVDKAMTSDLNVRGHVNRYLHELAKNGTENDETGLLRSMYNEIRDLSGNGYLTDNDCRYLVWKATSGASEGDLLSQAEDIAMQRQWKVGPYAENETPRFGVLDEFSTAADDAREAHKESVETAGAALKEARKSLKDELNPIVKAMSAQRTFDRATVSGIVKFAKKVMKEGGLDSLTMREANRLLTLVSGATGKSESYATRYADQLLDTVLDHIVKDEKGKFDKLVSVKDKTVKDPGIEKQGKLDVRGQASMKAFREAMNLSADEIEEKLVENSDRMSDGSAAVRSMAYAEHEGLVLARDYQRDLAENIKEADDLQTELDYEKEARKTGNIDRKTYGEYLAATMEAIRQNKMERVDLYRDFSSRLADIISGGASRAKAFREADKQRIEDIHHDANRDMEGTPTDEHRKDTALERAINSNIVRFFCKPLATFDQMLRVLGRKSITGEGYLWNRYMRQWVESAENSYTGFYDATKELDKKVSEVFGRKGMIWSDLYAEERKMPKATVKFFDGGKMKEHELTAGNLLYIYMVNKMVDGKMKLRRMGISEADVAAIVRNMDPRFIELADWLQNEYLVEKRNKYNSVHERMFGAPMAAIEDYFPIKILSNARVEDVDLGNSPESAGLSSTTTGSIIKRRKNSLALDLLHTDAFSLVIEHLQQMEDWAAFAEFRRDVNTLLSYKRFRNQVQNMNTIYGSGKALWNNFKDVASIATGNYRPKVQKGDVDNILLNVAKGVTAAKIAFRVNTAIKQILSAPAYLSDAKISDLAHNIAHPAASWNWCMENLPVFYNRWNSRIAGDTRLLDTDSDWKIWREGVVREASRLGMTPNAFVDALTVSVGAKAMYDSKYRQYIAGGYSEAQADKKARQDATILYNQTQQSAEGAFVSAMQLDRTFLSVLLTTYRNSSMSYQRQLHDALRTYGRMLDATSREERVDFMKRQRMNDGLDEETAEEFANREYDRQMWRSAVRMIIFGVGLQFLWNLGSDVWYLLFGKNGDVKKKMLKEAATKAVAGPIEGLSAGNIISDAWNTVSSGGDVKNLSLGELPAVSDANTILREMSYDKPAAIYDIVNLVIQSGIGVNPETVSDAVVAIIDACNGDMGVAKEAAMLMMRIMQVPQSTLDEFYLDELDMTAGQARKLSPAQLAERYAQYRLNKSAGPLRGLYSDETEKKRLKSGRERFKEKAKERKELTK